MIDYKPADHFKCNTLRRWKITLWGGISIRLHRWVEGDPREYQHSHPWHFVTFVLRGGYTDVGDGRPDDVVRAPAVRYRSPDWRHSVTKVLPGTWSLVVTGRVIERWKFWIGRWRVNEEEWNEREC